MYAFDLFRLFEVVPGLSSLNWREYAALKQVCRKGSAIRESPYYYEPPPYVSRITTRRGTQIYLEDPSNKHRMEHLRRLCDLCLFKRIDFSGIKNLTDHQVRALRLPPGLTHVSLRDCPAVRDFGFCGSDYLVEIDLSGTVIADADLVNFRTAKTVSLQMCPNVHSVSMLESVETLLLTGCQNLQPGAFQGLTRITELDVSHTSITVECISSLVDLKVLNCSHCPSLKELPPLPRLVDFYCTSADQFTDPFQSFCNVPNVKIFLLINTEMMTIFFSAMEKMKEERSAKRARP